MAQTLPFSHYLDTIMKNNMWVKENEAHNFSLNKTPLSFRVFNPQGDKHKY